jgi:hypothetical protein
MTPNIPSQADVSSGSATGEFYVIQPDIYSGGAGHDLTFSNIERLLTPPRRILRPAEGGFPMLVERPVLVQGPHGRALRDLEGSFSGYWLVSARLKKILETVAPDGFAFTICNVVLATGSPPEEHYLCDVLPVIDALDEENSKLQVKIGEEYINGKRYRIGPGVSLAFDRRKVIGTHVFRTPFHSYVFCDRSLRDAILGGECTGVSLEDASAF